MTQLQGKLLVILALVAVLGFISQPSTHESIRRMMASESQEMEEFDSFQEFKKEFHRQFGHEAEFEKFKHYKQNLEFILNEDRKYEEHLATAELGINDFADLTNEEFTRMHLGLDPKPVGEATFLLAGDYNQTYVNWAESAKGYTAIKNQGSCGSCWAFGTLGVVEDMLFKQFGEKIPLSEQQLVDCGKGNLGGNGCNGGWPQSAMKYIKQYGITTSSQYGYTAKQGTCKQDSVKSVYKIGDAVNVPRNSQSQLMAAINLGVVSVAIDAGGRDFQFYKKGVITNCGTSINHAVNAVGYGYDAETKLDYYLVKNSWGSNWGDKGFTKLWNKGDGVGTCAIQGYASYAKRDENQSKPQNDDNDQSPTQAPTQAPIPSECKQYKADANSGCSYWAKVDRACENSSARREYMLENCQQSCCAHGVKPAQPTQAPTQRPTQAPTQKPTQAPTQKPTQAPSGDCTNPAADKFSSCSKYVQKGYCKYGKWNTTYCATSCCNQANPTQAPTQKPTQRPTQAPTQKPTSAPSGNCSNAATDKFRSCSKYVQKGYCKYDKWNTTYCATSCCNQGQAPTQRPTQAPSGNCSNAQADQFSSCEKYAKKGYCKYDKWNTKYCPTTCCKAQ